MIRTLSDTDVFLRAKMQADPHMEIKVKLAEFLIALIQAFLRTGYYTPDHPESQKAKEGLYRDFQNLLAKKHELTFLVREEPQGKNILIEGVLPEVQDLKSLMIAGMAEMYVPRFAKFLTNKDLLSLTLKISMSPREFTSFVDLMGEPTFVNTLQREDKERFSNILQKRGIFHISYIYNEELLAGERKMHWRSHIALTRLKKDFRMVPLYMDLDSEGIKRVRQQIVRDVFRPFRNAEAIYSVLINSDLAETKEFSESAIDQEIIACLSDRLLLKVARALLEAAPQPTGQKDTRGKRSRLARQLTSSINQREIKTGELILKEYVKHNLVSVNYLPKTLQQRIRIERLAEQFLDNDNSFLIQFETIKDSQRYFEVARHLTEIIPELISQDLYETVLKIIVLLDRHAHEKKDRSARAAQILAEIGEGDILRALKGKFLTGQKDRCRAIAPIFVKLGGRALPHLVSILFNANDHLVRKNAGEIIAQIDTSIIKTILNLMTKRRLSTGATLDIIRALGQVGCSEWKQPLANILLGFINHANHHLRVEALRVYYLIKGAEGKLIYFDLLYDKDIGVKKEAIQCLARLKSNTALVKFIEILEQSYGLPADIKEEIEVCLFRALGFYDNIERPGLGTLEDFLLATLDGQLSFGPLKLLKQKKNTLNEEVIEAICEALGKIGTDKSREVLLKLGKQKESLWQQKATEALRKIAERLESRS